jgi:hypothetical protein
LDQPLQLHLNGKTREPLLLHQLIKLILLINLYALSIFAILQIPFDQVQIDHFPNSDRYVPHTKDTFKQRYFFDSSYYKPGGPVFLYIGGETSGESRFSNLQTGSECTLLWTMRASTDR